MKWYILRKSVLAGVVIVISLSAGIVFMSLKDLEEISAKSLDQKTYQTTTVVYADGSILANPSGENKKIPVKYEDIPEYMKKAIISIEDERFYKHPGVDLKGLVRSAVKSITGDRQGGSTLAMQTSKMLLTSSDVSIPRKIKDIVYAYEMDHKLGKEKVLELYLNNFSVGRGMQGVAAGAKGYFDKTLDQLTLSECALLAGSTQNPSKYSAYSTAKLDSTETKEALENRLLFYVNDQGAFDKATETELKFIDKLNEWKLIPDSSTYQRLKNGTMVVRKAIPNPQSIERRDLVLSKMLELGHISRDEYNKALKEDITIKLPKPSKSVTSAVEDYVEEETIDALIASGYSYDEAVAMYYSGGLKVTTTIDKDKQKALENIYADSSNFPKNITDDNGVLQPQSASVVLDNYNGEIKAMIGGRNVTGRKVLNRAVSPVQPGSSIKPLSVYAPALDKGLITSSSVYSDAEGGYKFDKNNQWNPHTTTGGHSNFDIKTAIAKSSNTIAVKVAEQLGASYDECIDVMIDKLKDFGLTDIVDSTKGQNDREFSSLTLGGMAKGAKPLDMASGFATLANNGKYVEPTIIRSIESYDGKSIYKEDPKPQRVVSDETAFIMTDMLQKTVTGGTGRAASLGKFPVAGKTGTTTDNMEAWFVGYTPYYTCATYISDDAGRVDKNGNSIKRRGVSGGSSSSAKLWKKIMTEMHTGLPDKVFIKPNNVKAVGGHFYKNLSGPGIDTKDSLYSKSYSDDELDNIESQNKEELKNMNKPDPKPQQNNVVQPSLNMPFIPGNIFR